MYEYLKIDLNEMYYSIKEDKIIQKMLGSIKIAKFLLNNRSILTQYLEKYDQPIRELVIRISLIETLIEIVSKNMNMNIKYQVIDNQTVNELTQILDDVKQKAENKANIMEYL